MITNLIVTGPFEAGFVLRPGNDFAIIAWSDQGMLNVRIKCFVRPPVPPTYRECNECGGYDVESGAQIKSRVNEKLFYQSTGFINIVASDRTDHVVAQTIHIRG